MPLEIAGYSYLHFTGQTYAFPTGWVICLPDQPASSFLPPPPPSSLWFSFCLSSSLLLRLSPPHISYPIFPHHSCDYLRGLGISAVDSVPASVIIDSVPTSLSVVPVDTSVTVDSVTVDSVEQLWLFLCCCISSVTVDSVAAYSYLSSVIVDYVAASVTINCTGGHLSPLILFPHLSYFCCCICHCRFCWCICYCRLSLFILLPCRASSVSVDSVVHNSLLIVLVLICYYWLC